MAKVSLIWDMFKSALYRPDPRSGGLLQPSFLESQSLQLTPRHNKFTFDEPDVETRPSHVYSAVDGCNEVLDSEDYQDMCGRSTKTSQPQQCVDFASNEVDGVTSQFDWVWATGLAQYYYDPSAQLHEQGGINLDCWELDNK